MKDSHYNYWSYFNIDSIDCSYCRNCEGSFECVDCKNCLDSTFLQDCEDCTRCDYCYDCQNLEDSFACIGLWRKKYHIFNKPYTEEKYIELVNKLKKKPPEELRKLFKEVKRNRPHVFMRQNRNKGECTGDYISNSKSSQYCFDTEKCSNCCYMNNAISCTDCMDISFAGEASVKDCYEIMSGMGIEHSMFCSNCWYGKSLQYCEYCFNCEYCFGCVGLKDRKFYILNRAFAPDQYFETVAEIVERMRKNGEYGKWFSSVYPPEDSKMCEENECIMHNFQSATHLSLEEKRNDVGIEWDKILR
ncbi:MAG: hypothetical protein WCT53_00410 [Candidatus Gracilibacteria bacterium]